MDDLSESSNRYSPGEEPASIRNPGIILSLIVIIAAVACKPDRPDDSDEAGDPSAELSAAECASQNAFDQIGCYADLAVRHADLAMCDLASSEGVRYQCYAIVAERQDDPLICQRIPSKTQDHLSLKDLCISDIAETRLDPELCSTVAGTGFRDGCYVKIAESIPDSSLCDRITDEGLKSLCTGRLVPDR